jgi:UDP-N-acetylglucosamine--N-acetylmuramyl-(pentapeptide) pyrophosphoryl-undecaprenol N-acetylglucosamine transferase
MKRKILLAAGGTGGHVYPAIALAEQLKRQLPAVEILFAAGGLEKNPFFSTHRFPYSVISAAPLAGRMPWHWFKSLTSIVKGYRQSRKLLAKFQPDIVIGFGSYHTFPLLLAARSAGFPIALHEQNSRPGKVVRYFADTALTTGIYFPSAGNALSGNSVELAMPLREGYRLGNVDPNEALQYFGLDQAKRTILLFGGSQGAQFINSFVAEALAKARLQNWQVIHLTGKDADQAKLQQLYRSAGVSAVVKGFEERMDLAWGISDFCIARAGAGSIAELLEFEVPTLLIPFPYASEDHQDSNADFLVDVVKGGWKKRERDLTQESLVEFVNDLLEERNSKLDQAKKNIVFYKAEACRKEFTEVIVGFLK